MNETDINYNFIRKDNTNKGTIYIYNSDSMLLTKMNYLINSFTINDYKLNKTVVFLNTVTTTWEDNDINYLKEYLLEKEKGAILFVDSNCTIKINDIKKYIAKSIIK